MKVRKSQRHSLRLNGHTDAQKLDLRKGVSHLGPVEDHVAELSSSYSAEDVEIPVLGPPW